jgi:hypothetical protein
VYISERAAGAFYEQSRTVHLTSVLETSGRTEVKGREVGAKGGSIGKSGGGGDNTKREL